jgi:nucleotide-binding universal stress UspA family protein
VDRRPRIDDLVMLTLRKILVPIDFNETSDKALDFAIELAQKFDAEVIVMHAYEIPTISFPEALVATFSIAKHTLEAARKGLDQTVSMRTTGDVKITSILREGRAWEEIRAEAEETHADLIVIGTHGRRGIARALLGSVAENVIRTVTTPVLTIHGPRD